MTVTGIAVTATGALAQAAPVDATVNFTGTVGSVCTFSNIVDGALEFDGSAILEANPIVGTQGSVDLDCTGPADVSVSLPVDNASTTDLLTGAAFFSADIEVAGDFASNSSTGGASLPANLVGPVNETINVGMFVDAGAPIQAGAYDYNVVVTATPQ
ncbi:MAG: hypothetical protein ABG776_05535 [Cyanobacteria bacterium J06555_13]